MPYADTEERQPLNVSYILEDTETGEERVFHKMMGARHAGEQMAASHGLSIEGWKQVQPSRWFLVPDGRFSITLVAARR